MSHYLVLLVSVFSIVNPLAATRTDGMLQLGRALLAAGLADIFPAWTVPASAGGMGPG